MNSQISHCPSFTQLATDLTSAEPFSADRYQPATVVFVDMVGFTTFCAENSPAVVIQVLRELLAILSDQVYAHGGKVEKFLGDGLMAAFGSPLAGSCDATNALRCALAMQLSVSEWNIRTSARNGRRIRIAVGIHSGHVIMGEVGNNRWLESAVLGDTVNVASRVEGKCRCLDTSILMTADVLSRIEDEGGAAFAQGFVDFGFQRLRGRQGTVHLHGLRR